MCSYSTMLTTIAIFVLNHNWEIYLISQPDSHSCLVFQFVEQNTVSHIFPSDTCCIFFNSGPDFGLISFMNKTAKSPFLIQSAFKGLALFLLPSLLPSFSLSFFPYFIYPSVHISIHPFIHPPNLCKKPCYSLWQIQWCIMYCPYSQGTFSLIKGSMRSWKQTFISC